MAVTPPLAGVLFDLGGTLLQHQPSASARRNLLAAAALAGVGAEEQQLVQTFARCRRSLEAAWATRPSYLHRHLVADSFAATCRAFDVNPGAAAIGHYCDAQRASVLAELRLRSDSLSTLAQLRARGLWLAIVSNIDEDYFAPLLARHQLADAVDVCLSSEVAQSCKPHRGIFDQAVAASGQAPESLLHVGDSPVNDVAGAQAVGMITALLDVDLPAEVHLPAAPDYRIGHLAALLPIVDRLLPTA